MWYPQNNNSLVPFRTTAMETREIKDERIVLEENDPPADLSREMAAFERERPRLVREHLGKIAVIHGDEVINPDGALCTTRNLHHFLPG